jgi:hypothetical protein
MRAPDASPGVLQTALPARGGSAMTQSVRRQVVVQCAAARP